MIMLYAAKHRFKQRDERRCATLRGCVGYHQFQVLLLASAGRPPDIRCRSTRRRNVHLASTGRPLDVHWTSTGRPLLVHQKASTFRKRRALAGRGADRGKASTSWTRSGPGKSKHFPGKGKHFLDAKRTWPRNGPGREADQDVSRNGEGNPAGLTTSVGGTLGGDHVDILGSCLK